MDHWGQRKLFLSELYFLTKYSKLGKVVIYAGAAPGTHIEYLATLFPEHIFLLVDPCHYDIKPTGLPHKEIILVNDYFTNELA